MGVIAKENRVDGREGSYLHRLSDDPIHWQPWGSDAFELATRHDAPVFLSIGDELSHWCRRMHAESFQDDVVAEILNTSFVPIAVDRVTRPEIDVIHQSVARAVEDIGGWPLSVWLTPSREPFYVGTYFPPEHTDHAPGFSPLIELIAERWDRASFRTDIDDRAAEWATYARQDLDLPPAESVDAGDALVRVASLALKTADPDYDGWGTGAKAPEPTRLQLLLTASVRCDLPECRAVAMSTMETIFGANCTIISRVGGSSIRRTVTGATQLSKSESRRTQRWHARCSLAIRSPMSPRSPGRLVAPLIS